MTPPDELERRAAEALLVCAFSLLGLTLGVAIGWVMWA